MTAVITPPPNYHLATTEERSSIPPGSMCYSNFWEEWQMIDPKWYHKPAFAETTLASPDQP